MPKTKCTRVSKTLAFWQGVAERMALTRIDGRAKSASPATADDLDDHLESLRRRSEQLLGEGTPYVPALVRLFIEADADLMALLEAYGRNTLQPEEKDTVTSLMQAMPGLWAAATEIKMLHDRDRLFDSDDDMGDASAEALVEAEQRKKRQIDRRGGPWSTSERPTGAWPDYHSLTIW